MKVTLKQWEELSLRNNRWGYRQKRLSKLALSGLNFIGESSKLLNVYAYEAVLKGNQLAGLHVNQINIRHLTKFGALHARHNWQIILYLTVACGVVSVFCNHTVTSSLWSLVHVFSIPQL